MVLGGADIDHDDSSVAADYEVVKAKLDAYGVGVRAGGITPHQADEKSFRSLLALPDMSQFIDTSWADDDGFRRPITLSNGQIDAKTDGYDDPEEVKEE